jgi:hypothetical protein
MAVKAKKKAPVAATAAPGADDLAILNPNRDVKIAGRVITVREYGFIEGLALEPLIKPFVEDLYELMKDGRVVHLPEITVLLADHGDLIVDLMAKSCDVEAEWIRELNDSDGRDLMFMWWAVCNAFFTKRVIDRLRAQKAAERLLAGETSTPS